MKKLHYEILWILPLVFILFATSCKKDKVEIDLPLPVISNLEIGSGNNGEGIIGRDFHFDMDVIAGDLIESVVIKIEQRDDEVYANDWSFEVVWDEYHGIKNTNVHKHFDIPDEAPEGRYHLIVLVHDQNGTTLEEVREIRLIDASKLPVDPTVGTFMLRRGTEDGTFKTFYDFKKGFTDPTQKHFSKGDHFDGLASVSNVRDDGSMYFLLIKKSLNHKPETVDAIDFSKVIVYDALKHENVEERKSFSNFLLMTEWGERGRPEFIIGAAEDNNTPASNPIGSDKNWENGAYYFGVVYTNTTHNLSVHHYMELEISGF